MDDEVLPADAAGPTRAGLRRRQLLGVGAGGAAAVLVPLLGGRAAATTPPPGGGLSATTTPASTTTTTEPPKRPTVDDTKLLGFLQRAERAANQLYEKSLTITSLDDTQRTVLTALTQAHRSYGQALSGLLGRDAPNAENQDVIDANSDKFGGDLDSMLAAASELESALVATHTEAIGKLEGTDAANLLASIVTVEARHGTVLADMRGAKDLSELLVDKEADALAPATG